ncbi:hypothetical protein SNEBB_009358 [Seison nebaliae]|nr:hypothetical protein SNEBB_009358 [Seison nebaliae]
MNKDNPIYNSINEKNDEVSTDRSLCVSNDSQSIIDPSDQYYRKVRLQLGIDHARCHHSMTTTTTETNQINKQTCLQMNNSINNSLKSLLSKKNQKNSLTSINSLKHFVFPLIDYEINDKNLDTIIQTNPIEKFQRKFKSFASRMTHRRSSYPVSTKKSISTTIFPSCLSEEDIQRRDIRSAATTSFDDLDDDVDDDEDDEDEDCSTSLDDEDDLNANLDEEDDDDDTFGNNDFKCISSQNCKKNIQTKNLFSCSKTSEIDHKNYTSASDISEAEQRKKEPIRQLDNMSITSLPHPMLKPFYNHSSNKLQQHQQHQQQQSKYYFSSSTTLNSSASTVAEMEEKKKKKNKMYSPKKKKLIPPRSNGERMKEKKILRELNVSNDEGIEKEENLDENSNGKRNTFLEKTESKSISNRFELAKFHLKMLKNDNLSTNFSRRIRDNLKSKIITSEPPPPPPSSSTTTTTNKFRSSTHWSNLFDVNRFQPITNSLSLDESLVTSGENEKLVEKKTKNRLKNRLTFIPSNSSKDNSNQSQQIIRIKMSDEDDEGEHTQDDDDEEEDLDDEDEEEDDYSDENNVNIRRPSTNLKDGILWKKNLRKKWKRLKHQHFSSNTFDLKQNLTLNLSPNNSGIDGGSDEDDLSSSSGSKRSRDTIIWRLFSSQKRCEYTKIILICREFFQTIQFVNFRSQNEQIKYIICLKRIRFSSEWIRFIHSYLYIIRQLKQLNGVKIFFVNDDFDGEPDWLQFLSTYQQNENDRPLTIVGDFIVLHHLAQLNDRPRIFFIPIIKFLYGFNAADIDEYFLSKLSKFSKFYEEIDSLKLMIWKEELIRLMKENEILNKLNDLFNLIQTKLANRLLEIIKTSSFHDEPIQLPIKQINMTMYANTNHLRNRKNLRHRIASSHLRMIPTVFSRKFICSVDIIQQVSQKLLRQQLQSSSNNFISISSNLSTSFHLPVSFKQHSPLQHLIQFIRNQSKLNTINDQNDERKSVRRYSTSQFTSKSLNVFSGMNFESFLYVFCHNVQRKKGRQPFRLAAHYPIDLMANLEYEQMKKDDEKLLNESSTVTKKGIFPHIHIDIDYGTKDLMFQTTNLFQFIIDNDILFKQLSRSRFHLLYQKIFYQYLKLNRYHSMENNEMINQFKFNIKKLNSSIILNKEMNGKLNNTLLSNFVNSQNSNDNSEERKIDRSCIINLFQFLLQQLSKDSNQFAYFSNFNYLIILIIDEYFRCTQLRSLIYSEFSSTTSSNFSSTNEITSSSVQRYRHMNRHAPKSADYLKLTGNILEKKNIQSKLLPNELDNDLTNSTNTNLLTSNGIDDDVGIMELFALDFKNLFQPRSLRTSVSPIRQLSFMKTSFLFSPSIQSIDFHLSALLFNCQHDLNSLTTSVHSIKQFKCTSTNILLSNRNRSFDRINNRIRRRNQFNQRLNILKHFNPSTFTSSSTFSPNFNSEKKVNHHHHNDNTNQMSLNFKNIQLMQNFHKVTNQRMNKTRKLVNEKKVQYKNNSTHDNRKSSSMRSLAITLSIDGQLIHNVKYFTISASSNSNTSTNLSTQFNENNVNDSLFLYTPSSISSPL